MSASRQPTGNVRRQSASMSSPHPRSVHVPINVRVDGCESLRSVRRPAIAQSPKCPPAWTHHVHMPCPQDMSEFDPIIVRKAVTEFAPPRPERFRELSVAKDFIASCARNAPRFAPSPICSPGTACRSAKAPWRNFVTKSWASIPPDKRRPRKRPPASNLSEGEPLSTITTTSFLPTTGNFGENQQPRVRGPHIAQVRMRKPQTT